MYKLDLDDPRLNLPVPIYRDGGRFAPRMPGRPVAFQALERPAPGTIAVGGFHLLPLDAKSSPGTTAVLYGARGKEGPFYFVEPALLALYPARAIGRAWKAGADRPLPAE